MPARTDWPPLERMMMEYEAIGFYLSAHPLDGASAALGRLGVTPLDQITAAVERGLVRLRVAGVVLSKQERGPAGQRFAFIRISDPSGSLEVAGASSCNAERWKRRGNILQARSLHSRN